MLIVPRVGHGTDGLLYIDVHVRGVHVHARLYMAGRAPFCYAHQTICVPRPHGLLGFYWLGAAPGAELPSQLGNYAAPRLLQNIDEALLVDGVFCRLATENDLPLLARLCSSNAWGHADLEALNGPGWEEQCA